MSDRISRRGFISAATAATAASVVSATGASALTAQQVTQNLNLKAQTATLDKAEEFFGAHQNGVELELQTFTNFIAFELNSETDKSAMLRWMSVLTDDFSRLSIGKPVLADAQPQLALGPARLTFTVGFGPSLFMKLGLEALMPESFQNLPDFKIDKLQSKFSNGDVLVQVSCDDPVVLSHAVRAVIRDSLSFAKVHYSQQGFSNAQGVSPSGTRQRNLMGQVDGTDNPALQSDDFNRLVWIESGPEWAVGGTILVLRRISMHLDTWDKLGRTDKELVIGRDLAKGAPLGKSNENDVPDFDQRAKSGLTVIPPFAHIRRASASNPNERFFRRPFNYEVGVSAQGVPDVGMLWTAYMRNMNQYVPVQTRLASFDLLNQWTTPIGSAVFAIPGGVEPGKIISEKLFS
jgi:dye decolorizing peroxidase